uniref:Uncharacterized protein n=1 Tax=Schistosoma curassoni TaxID=6186 RepID=A0A183JML9_9TREM
MEYLHKLCKDNLAGHSPATVSTKRISGFKLRCLRNQRTMTEVERKARANWTSLKPSLLAIITFSACRTKV